MVPLNRIDFKRGFDAASDDKRTFTALSPGYGMKGGKAVCEDITADSADGPAVVGFEFSYYDTVPWGRRHE